MRKLIATADPRNRLELAVCDFGRKKKVGPDPTNAYDLQKNLHGHQIPSSDLQIRGAFARISPTTN
jgi:hypothetical protein